MIFSDLTIGKKISGSFLIILIFLLTVATAGIIGFGNIETNATEVIDGNKLDGILAQREVDHLVWVNKVNSLLTDENITTLNVQTDDHKCGLGKWLYGEGRKDAELLVPHFKPQLKALESPHLRLHISAIEIGKLFKPIDAKLGEFLSQKKNDHLIWMHQIKDAILNKSNELNIQLDPTKCGLGKWIYSKETQALSKTNPEFSSIYTQMVPLHKQLHGSAKNIKAHLKNGEFDLAHSSYVDQTAKHAENTLAKIDLSIKWHNKNAEGVTLANRTYANETIPALSDIQALLKEIRKIAKENIMSDQVMLSSAQSSKTIVVSLSIFVLVLGLLFSFLTTRGLTTVLKKVTDGISEGATQVALAAQEISSSSQSLAENASEQAATIEETSASVQQITANSRQTSEMTKGAEDLMNTNIEKSGQSLVAIVDITSKINQIVNDSDKIGEIIKNIDQIAFQTNLLALNAAVEAARAGEAGAGFAVVADEVRNLAIRSTEAAKNTQELLDETISRIQQVSSSIGIMNNNFEGIVESATVIGEKTQGITSASVEIARGLEQIATATSEIDKVTQHVASNSEESAAASEELSAQAEEMGVIVTELTQMVYGKNHSNSFSSTSHSDINCWEVKNCPPDRRDACPAYPDGGDQCWMVTSTLCGGEVQGSYKDKMANCRNCDVYQISKGTQSTNNSSTPLLTQ